MAIGISPSVKRALERRAGAAGCRRRRGVDDPRRFGHQFLPPTVNQKALRSSSGSLAKFAAMRRASSRVSRFGRRAVQRSDMSGIGREAEARGLRLKRS
jgi:hypothetical protein